MKRITALVFALFLLPVMAFGALASSVPTPGPDFYVYDGAGTLSKSTEELILDANGPLEKYCDGAQIVVVTIDYLPSGYDSEQYANLLFNSWKVGSSESNNGLLLLHVVMEDRGWLAVGAGLTTSFSEDYVNSLMDEYFWPYSDAGQYDEAVATFFPRLIDRFAELYGTNMLYGGTGSTSSADSSSPDIGYQGDGYYDYNDYYYDRRSSASSTMITLLVVFIIVIALVNSVGRRRYYRSTGAWPMFFFCGGPRGPRGPRPPHGPGPGNRPGGFGGGGGFRGGGFGGGGFSGGGGFRGGGFGGGGHSGGGGGGRR